MGWRELKLGSVTGTRFVNKVRCQACGTVNEEGSKTCVECGGALLVVDIQVQEEAPAEFQPGQLIAQRYVVNNVIGRGGMGCIYRVEDTTLKEVAALKTLLLHYAQDKQIVARFLNEARIARQLSHPNIVRVHDIGIESGIIYISMEFIPGKSLRELMDELPPGYLLPLPKILEVFDELCAALKYAHDYTVHRDIKPENVMIATSGAVKLMDFGISKLMSNPNLTATSMVMGTPHYMSPEQLRNSASVDARADIYSVGVMLYEIVTGLTPAIVPRAASELSRGVPAGLDTVIATCLETDPEKRYGTAVELREALSAVAKAVREQSTSQRLKEGARGRRVAMAQRAIAMGLLALIGAGFVGGMAKVESDRRGLAAEISGAESPGLAQRAGPPTTPDEQFQFMGSLVEQARGIALGRPSGEFGEWVSEGERAWAVVKLGFEVDTAERVRAGWNALHLLIAAAAAPRGMVFIPAGEVTTQTGGVAKRSLATPAFLIQANEVTSGEYGEFARTSEWRSHEGAGDPEAPATNVSFYDAQAYAASNGLRLPSEAQWARAAYGKSGLPVQFPWGDEWEEEAANSGGGGGPQTVGSHEKDKTHFGCYDMYGNVMEWTRTLSQPSSANSKEAPNFGASMIVRGGSYGDLGQDGLLRAVESPYSTRSPWVGFRCVYELPTSLTEAAALLSEAEMGL